MTELPCVVPGTAADLNGVGCIVDGRAINWDSLLELGKL